MQYQRGDKISDPIVIEVENVKKNFTTFTHINKGFLSVLRRKKKITKALKGVNFTIKKGEIVALLGKNGSGKSTMLKILTGILYPDSGNVNVLGVNPSIERRKISERIGVMFGSQHLQLSWNLPPMDTFIFMKEIYGIPEKVFEKRLKYFIKILNLKQVYLKPTRQLSLGERMKCELVAASLHQPEIIFLDEPTVGVDLPSRNAIKEAISKMREDSGTTIIITTHVVEDITEVDRIIMFDKGNKLFDGNQEILKKRFGKNANVIINSKKANELKKLFEKYGHIRSKGDNYLKLKVKTSVLSDRKFMQLLNNKDIVDFRISDESLTDLLNALYKTSGD